MWGYTTNDLGDNSWGIFGFPTNPPTPNLATDSAATIASDWSLWTTSDPEYPASFQTEFGASPSVSLLNVTVRSQFTDNVVNEVPAERRRGLRPGERPAVDDLGPGQREHLGRHERPVQPRRRDILGRLDARGRGNSFSNSDPTAQTGVMFRNDTTPSAAMAALVETPSQGVEFLWRTTAGGAAAPPGLRRFRAGVAGNRACGQRLHGLLFAR